MTLRTIKPVFLLVPVLGLALGGLVSCVSSSSTAAFGQMPEDPTFTGQREEDSAAPLDDAGARPDGFTPEEEIVFTDPDNPDATLPELSGLLTDPKRQRGPWERNIRVARKNSIREGKPLLIWFTNSQRSPRCRQLSEELFNQPEFQKWAGENLIRMRVDEAEDFDDPELSLGQVQTLRVEFAAYVKRLKNHYKVLGLPSLVLVDPQGRVVGHYRGYKPGQADLTWGRIKQGVVASNHGHKAWREQLQSRGYREWKDLQGRKLVARLLRYDAGTLHLVEPDGSRSVVDEKTLSMADRRWIEEQKAMRQGED